MAGHIDINATLHCAHNTGLKGIDDDVTISLSSVYTYVGINQAAWCQTVQGSITMAIYQYIYVGINQAALHHSSQGGTVKMV